MASLATIDGVTASAPGALADARGRWRTGDVLMAEDGDGRRLILSSHPRPEGGRVFVAAPLPTSTLAEPAPAQPTTARDEAIFLRRLLEACPANLLVSRMEDGEVIYRSPSSQALFGDCPNAELQWDIEDERLTFCDLLSQTGDVEDFFRIARGPDGQPFPSLISARLYEHAGEQIVVSSTTDLTEAFALRDASDLANARLRDAIESLDEAFALFDSADRLVMCNRLYREAHREAASALKPGRTRIEIIEAIAAAGHLAEGGGVCSASRPTRPTRGEMRRHDGAVYLATRSPTKEGGTVTTLLDITERKRAEEAEREADALVRTIVEACPTTFLVSRVSDGKVLYCPPASRDRFGDIESTLSFFITPEDREVYLEALLPTRAINDYRVRFKRRDGTIMEGLTSARVTEYKGEDIIVSSTRDITVELEMRAELERQREIAHQNEKLSALGGLLAGVAHELNNPLSIVVGYALMLREKVKDPVLGRRVERIGQAAERCAKIVKTFLAMARQRPAQIETVDLEGLISTAIDIAGYGIQSRGGTITFETAPDLPHVAVDADQIVQVFSNLIANAEHALAARGADGRLEIAARADTAANRVRIVLADNGEGIPQDIQARIFEPFFTTKDVGAGTGVGLAFCHRIISSHGGSLCVDSRPGCGATFLIDLPIAAEKEPDRRREADATQPAEMARILVVDDEPDVAEMIADLLKDEGYRVHVETDVEDALAAVSAHRFDAVLSDIKMPGLGGEGFLAALEAEENPLARRLAFITGDAMSGEVARFLTESGRPHLEKPVAPDELCELVAGLCSAEEDSR
ncbi:MAG: ATP-binding protein [Pseudomonadota bacterium]